MTTDEQDATKLIVRRSVKRNIRAMRDAFCLDEDEMVEIVKEVYHEGRPHE